MATTLILGANRGIGLGLAQEFLTRGWRVIATARDPQGATALRELGARFPGKLGVHALDVTDDAAVRDLSAQLEWDAIDVLVHNAGVYGPRMAGVEEVDSEEWMEVLSNDGSLVAVRRAQRGTRAAEHQAGALLHHGTTLVREVPIAVYRDEWNLR